MKGLPALAIAALMAVGARADAQHLRGRVVLSDSTSPGVGLIVIAADAKGATAASVLTGIRGDFDLRMPHAGRYDLKVLRIGFKPTLVPGITVGNGETSPLTIVARGDPVALTAVRVRGESVCKVRQDSGQLVARLWEEARKAIYATQLSAPGEPLVAQWITYDRATDPSGTVLLAEHVVPDSGATGHPFASLPPDSLARTGYTHHDRGDWTFFGPDADVLLSDSFAELHCFHAEPPTPDHRAWIGIGFRPTRERSGLNDIEGTLWLDRESAELRLIEYAYTNVPREFARAKVGGAVEFLRLSTGNWFVSQWVIRMPRATEHAVLQFDPARVSPPTPMKQIEVEGLQFAGGEVRRVERDGDVLYTTGMATGADLVASLPRTEGGGVCGDAITARSVALLHGSVLESTGAAPGATVSVAWKVDSTIDVPNEFNRQRFGSKEWKWEVHEVTSSALGWWFMCGVPRQRLLTAKATILDRVSPEVLVKVAKTDSIARVDLRLPPR